jgi:hypothetical protein
MVIPKSYHDGWRAKTQTLIEFLRYNHQPMDELTKQLAIRDRFRRKLNLQLTPEQRLEKLAQLQAAAWDILRCSPDGYAHFLRRNFRARSIRGWDRHGE